MSPRSVRPPRLSVVVPTYGRPERVANLLVRLDAQTLDSAEFEVIFVDDGTPEPIRVDPSAHAVDLRVLRQPNAGPGAARNLGVEHARAPLVIFLNDDAVPANDLLEVHVSAHAKGLEKTAVMGSFPFTRSALNEPFTQLLAESDLLFDFPGLRDNQLHAWTFFWTCNISLPRAALLEVGGFDTRTFKEAIVEDVELGYRLEQRGWKVLYRADARCEHEHALTVDDYFRRAQRLGVNLARMWRKHQDARILWRPPGTKIEREYFRGLQLKIEKYRESADRFVEMMRRLSAEMGAKGFPQEERARLQQ
ncbi:MAG: glycosyltransferase family 2 protein, partial [Steroidobacteraceae bacterium]